MNDFNVNSDDKNISEKFGQNIIKFISNLFNIKNIAKIFELLLLLVFTLFYRKKPLVDWEGIKVG